jgi:hypothetical protein
MPVGRRTARKISAEVNNGASLYNDLSLTLLFVKVVTEIN